MCKFKWKTNEENRRDLLQSLINYKGYYIYTYNEIVEKQKTWDESYELKKFVFNDSPHYRFWLLTNDGTKPQQFHSLENILNSIDW